MGWFKTISKTKFSLLISCYTSHILLLLTNLMNFSCWQKAHLETIQRHYKLKINAFASSILSFSHKIPFTGRVCQNESSYWCFVCFFNQNGMVVSMNYVGKKHALKNEFFNIHIRCYFDQYNFRNQNIDVRSD